MNNCSYEDFKKKILNNPWDFVADLAMESNEYYSKNKEFICKEDKLTIDLYNSANNRKQEHKFILDILPVPFEGNIFNAKFIILTLNPGFVEEVNHKLYSLLNEDAKKQITDYHIQNLRLQCKEFIPNDAVRFIGDRYWFNKTHQFRKENNFELSAFAIVQYIGYQSTKFLENKVLKELKSVEFTGQLLKYVIETRNDNYCFIIARNEKFWRNELSKYASQDKLINHIVVLKNYLNTSISLNNIKDECRPIIYRITEQQKNNN
ncbi:hypothetical protein EKL98_08670 [Flavobacterium bomense]|uniref:Uncharacterized protein n=1 Tax=Flavobacterium bomense TaxID=2497483 RepID=A0A432CMB1_9FLAO|nr:MULTISPECIES: hypothetical protein [Flavobacterium]RTY91859.1 hypothetical protein EKM01_04350 [Flavobacterium sp. RSP46]RTZ02328.1 hypothetical protein EKM03_14285 [Flavobacterium sp. GSP6]RTZ04613.1 hypothetical protein EKL98_08670 [Flavobacterium bomense]